MRIVVVDDSSADRKLYRLLLGEEYGPDLIFEEAADAERGLELCCDPTRPPPDCVLFGRKLPDMTGAEFLRALVRRSPGASETPHPAELPGFAVVVLTRAGKPGASGDSVKDAAHDDPIDDCVTLVKHSITAASLRVAIEKATAKVALLRGLQAERDRLAQLLAEKDALIEEVHHRVKNNLQVIASLLRLQGERAGDARLADALRDSQNRIESMALIHEQLYQARNLREVDLAEHASLLANRLSDAYGIDPARVRCRVNVAEIRLRVDRAIPAALILNELISNAFKHAFPRDRRGSIAITGRITGRGAGVREAHEEIRIEVRDDGVGCAPGGAAPQTLGLHIVDILTRQLRGQFSIENGRGTVCRLRFPAQGGNHASRKNRVETARASAAQVL